MILAVSCCLWVLAAAAVALLPMRHQFVPGLFLLVLAPALLIWVAFEAGLIWSLFALLAFGSMFRKPLKYLALRARDRAFGRPS